MVPAYIWSYLKLQRNDKRRKGAERPRADASTATNEQVGVSGVNAIVAITREGLVIKIIKKPTRW